MTTLGGALTLLLLCLGDDEATSRRDVIENLRNRKDLALRPETLNKPETFARRVQDQDYLKKFREGYHGWRFKLGNLATGAGFAIGPEYHADRLMHGRVKARFSVQGATSLSWKTETHWEAPRFANNWLGWDFLAAYRDYNRIDYYGPGPDSTKGGRSNYRLEDTSWETQLVLRRLPRSRLGGVVGYSWFNVGPGKRDGVISTDQAFGPALAPGINRQTNFLTYGLFYQFDYRDNPAGPKSGGNYVLQQTWYRDNVYGAFGFRRLDLDLQQYIAMFNGTHRFALRAKTVLTDTDGLEVVPFYLQPILGGSDDLRGFRPYRFRDRNMLVLNGEYRWEVFSGLDGALFVDGGKVFPRRGFLNLNDLEGAYGFGLRFNAKNTTFLRLDVGFSHEGWQIWFKFNDPFLPRRFGATRQQPIY
ncbi:MAG: BamA/TamA family outer membrane protein [Bryobacterales bacterium]|nr:BamA/TamA family outer membrane protein [Bryobacterales bacterium]